MTLAEILKSQGLTEEQIATITGEMKQNKIFTASEENLDVRYGKLKNDHEAITAKQAESDKLIAELQKANKGNEAIQQKISEYEATIAEKDEELQKTKVESAVKVALLGAKAVDVDYLTFKLKEKGEIKLDDQGNIKGIDDMLASLKTQYPSQFETTTQKKIEEHKLPNGDPETKITKEEFSKMGYQQRMKLYNDNPDMYAELSGTKAE